MHVNLVEAIWLVVSLLGVIFTAVLLLDSIGERETVRDLGNGRQALRLFIVRGNIRRESIRLAVQIILLLAVVPSALRPGEFNLRFDLSTPEGVLATSITVAVLGLICVPIGMTISSFFDARDRRIIRAMAYDLIRTDDDHHSRLIRAALEEMKLVSTERHQETEDHLDRQDEVLDVHDQRFSTD